MSQHHGWKRTLSPLTNEAWQTVKKNRRKRLNKRSQRFAADRCGPSFGSLQKSQPEPRFTQHSAACNKRPASYLLIALRSASKFPTFLLAHLYWTKQCLSNALSNCTWSRGDQKDTCKQKFSSKSQRSETGRRAKPLRPARETKLLREKRVLSSWL